MEPTETNQPFPESPEAIPATLESFGSSPKTAIMDSPSPTDALLGAAPVIEARLYEVAQGPVFSAHEMRRLEADYEELLQRLTGRLSLYFRSECELELESLKTSTFRQWVSGRLQPTHLTLFKVEPWRGIGVLEISPALGLAMTDRLMGGSGQAATVSRELSEIETALLDQVAQFVTEAWCAQWQRWQELTPALLGHESDARYLQTSPPDSTMLVAAIHARLGDCRGQIQLALPLATIEVLIQKLRAELKPAVGDDTNAATPRALRWNAALDDMTMALTADLPGLPLTARSIPQLKVGDTLELPANATNQVHLRLGGLTRFIGRLGTRDDHWAVELTDVLKP
ncbi:MAG: flagellar motor switch protein FliM [Verrucomicrobia bacterium]|nr:flagellar motor switch protein FliM [Verrucomicrobiota bacterium]